MERRVIWRQRILHLQLFRAVQEMIRRAGGPVDNDLVQETVILNLPEENYEKSFATFVDWAKYCDLFAFDDMTKKIDLGH